MLRIFNVSVGGTTMENLHNANEGKCTDEIVIDEIAESSKQLENLSSGDNSCTARFPTIIVSRDIVVMLT